MIYNRTTKSMEDDIQYGGKYLDFFYNNCFGRILLKIIINPLFSKIYGRYNSTIFSKNKIQKFIKKYYIDINEYEEKDYKSFNEFFIRKKKRVKFDNEKNSFIAPADSKLLVYKITEDLKIKIKQSVYEIDELILDKIDFNKYKNGNCLVFRLAMDDYHRYCYIDDGKTKNVKFIKGKVHTVSSISSNYKIYSENSRIVNYLETQNFGEVLYVEVGALLVGKIKNNNKEYFLKGEEKGYFELGGSTIVILINDKIKMDGDILEQSNRGIETKVKYGERIGELKC